MIDSLAEEIPACQTERDTLGFDHAELGEFVAAQWHLPEHLTTSIRYHHAPLEYVGEHEAMVCTVALADFFCHAKGVTAMGMGRTEVPPAEVFGYLGLDRPVVSSIWGRLDDALTAANIMALVKAE